MLYILVLCRTARRDGNNARITSCSLYLTESEHAELEQLVRKHTILQQIALLARIILLAETVLGFVDEFGEMHS